jgi:hypothetical protein
MFMVLLLAADALLFGFALLFTIETLQAREYLAPKFGIAGIFLALLLATLIVWVPGMRIPLAVLFGLPGGFIAACLIPGKSNPKALKGTTGYVVGETKRFDERDIVFARCRMSPEQTEQYRQYYEVHPELEEADAKRREKGFLGHPPGRIDKGYLPNVSMLKASFDIPDMLGKYAIAEPHPEPSPVQIDAAKATKIVKNFAKHLGADLVGICKVNPNWLYSHRGEIHYNNWDDWGKEITNDLPYAVVIAVEMSWEHVSAAPHTPTVAESADKYAQGAYISRVS